MRRGSRSAVLAVALALAGSQAQSQVPVVGVQPSGSSVPANLLRLSIRFATPPAGPVLARLALLRNDGSAIAQPFLEQELWSADGRVLTVLMHPGRVKSGLAAREALGPILSAGDDVTLALGGAALKRWRVGVPDEAGPQPSAWALSPVSAGSSKPLVVTLDAPIDGRDADGVAIADAYGRRIAGRARLTAGERVWTFAPASPWRAGSYTLRVRGSLEDPSGNRLDGRFENPASSRPGEPQDAAIPFSIGR